MLINTHIIGNPMFAILHVLKSGPSIPVYIYRLSSISNVGAKGARLFTHSYLGLGFDAALQKAADLVNTKAASSNSGEGAMGAGAVDPCLPMG